jgi:hypothetical protein
MQIYSLLPSYKQVRVIEDFDSIILSIWNLKQEMLVEQEILLGETLKNIEEKLKWVQKNRINAWSRESIALLKNMI